MLTLQPEQLQIAEVACIGYTCYHHNRNQRETGNKNPSWLSNHIKTKTENNTPMCSPETQPLPTKPKSSSVQRKTGTAQTCKETRQPPTTWCTSPWASAGESWRHLAFSSFSTLSLLGWERGRVFVFTPLSLASYIAYLPQLWLLLRASFYSTYSRGLSLCCSPVHLCYTRIQVLLKNYKMKLVSVHYDGTQISQPTTALPPCPNRVPGLEVFTPATYQKAVPNDTNNNFHFYG